MFDQLINHLFQFTPSSSSAAILLKDPILLPKCLFEQFKFQSGGQRREAFFKDWLDPGERQRELSAGNTEEIVRDSFILQNLMRSMNSGNYATGEVGLKPMETQALMIALGNGNHDKFKWELLICTAWNTD